VEAILKFYIKKPSHQDSLRYLVKIGGQIKMAVLKCCNILFFKFQDSSGRLLRKQQIGVS